MTHLLNLLAAIALLVWGTYLVRTGVLRVLGSKLRQVLAASMANRFTAALSGLFPGGHFPAFNIADTGITIGAMALILDEILRVRRSR